METHIVAAGFGGQGVMSIGKLIAETAVSQDLDAAWVPSYGPEMRGGTANCSIIISQEAIASPVVTNPTVLIAMNQQSLDKFEDKVSPDGTIFVNSSIIKSTVHREDVSAVYISCDEIAASLGSGKVANMVMLGAFAAATGALKLQAIKKLIVGKYTGAKAKLAEINIKALEYGYSSV